MQAPVVGSQGTPGGQCSHPLVMTGSSSSIQKIISIMIISKFGKSLR